MAKTGLTAVVGIALSLAVAGYVFAGDSGGGATEPATTIDDGRVGPMSVRATLSRVPAVGRTASLSVVVLSPVRRERAKIVVELPPMLDFERIPEGMTRTTGRSALGQHIARKAVMRRRLDANIAVRLSFVLRARVTGTGQILATATAPIVGGTVGDGASVFLTVR